jgi:hypothetical protein
MVRRKPRARENMWSINGLEAPASGVSAQICLPAATIAAYATGPNMDYAGASGVNVKATPFMQ